MSSHSKGEGDNPDAFQARQNQVKGVYLLLAKKIPPTLPCFMPVYACFIIVFELYRQVASTMMEQSRAQHV